MKNCKLLQRVRVYKIFVMLAIILGISLRLIFLLFNRPMWNDECALALNIIHSRNYFIPLEYSQAAPQLFMYLSKIFYLIIPVKTFALRLVPFVSAILSIWFFYKLTVKFLNKKYLQISALTAFSICYPLCRYSQEFKPYSSDVLCFLLILLSYFYIDKISESGNKLKFLYGILGSIFIWLSFSSVFALFSALLTLLIFNRKVFKTLYIPLLIIGLNVVLLAGFNFHLSENGYLHSYWSNAFINKGFLHFLSLNFENIRYIFNIGLPLFFILLSIVYILFKDRQCAKNYLLLIPVVLLMILSYLGIYPYSTRIILFLIPIFILLSFKFIDYIKFKIIGIICVILILFPMALETFRNVLLKGYEEENIVAPLQIVAQEAAADDIVYISEGNSILYEYYKNEISLGSPVVVEHERYNDNLEYVKHLNELKKGKTYYWVFAHHPDKFARLKSVYLWAKEKPDFKMYADRKGNALIRFTIF